MKYRYTKFTGDELDDLDLEDLVAKLSDLLLASGFGNPHGIDEDERTLQALHDAILDALFNGGVLPEETIERLLGDPADGDQEDARSKLEELIQQIIERMTEQGYITTPPDLDAERARRQGRTGGRGPDQPPVTFEVTDKTLDFLGYRALRDLLGSLGKSSYGRHDTREQATGVETTGAPKPYEFGDTLNLDPASTLLNAVQREAREARESAVASLKSSVESLKSLVPESPSPQVTESRSPQVPSPRRIHVTHEDLMVVQGEYQSSCATVLMLDCSHSMILYGEDRFTPAKRVALALAQLIKTQYPGDALKVVLFHDSAEEIPLAELGRVRVGPYYTNTREGLRLSRRILDRQRKDMRQIIMITDGKPSALTQPDGRIYKNAFGLDPFIVAETCAEVAACRKSGIMINTFMLARDYDLVSFVRRVADICKGKAYFTTPYTLGQYVLMDYMDKKTKTIH
ncbi:MAG TPA: VWA domain-containing protein [Vicinamibacterales bacterium]|nr:VWA domain-containing protein [Vicinamibacterales bacterium]